MSLKSVFLGLVAVAAVAAGYAIYAPNRVEGYSPQAAAYARSARAAIPDPLRAYLPKETAAVAPAAPAAPQAAAPVAVPVEAETAVQKDFPVILSALGQISAYQTVTVRARVDGQIDKIAFQEGQIVHQGDLLAEIDPRPFQAALDQATAKKAQDEANLANAKRDFDRYSTLVKQSFASQQQFDTQAALVNSDKALVEGDDASIDAAKVQLGYTKIYAPLTGRVGYRLIDQGNMVQASQQTGIVVINQLQPIAALFTAPEEQVVEINRLMRSGGAKVAVKTTDGQALSDGALEVVDNQIDATTGTVKLKAKFENKDFKLWPGLAVIADLTLGVDKNAVVIPTAAVQHGAKGLFVYVIGDDNKVNPRPVVVAHQNTQEAALASGVKAGERIVTAGQSRLRPGALVAVETASSRS